MAYPWFRKRRIPSTAAPCAAIHAAGLVMVDRVTPEFAEPLRASERMVLAWRQTPFARRTWFAVILAAIFVLHATILAVLLWRDDPVAAPRAEETSVEVVAEMPEPPKATEPPAPKPQPSAAQPPDKPATSAPRAQNDEKIDRDTGESETHAPKAKTADASPPPTEKPSPDKPEPEKRDAKLEAKPEQAVTEQPRPEPAKEESAKADSAKTDSAKTDVAKAEDKPAEAPAADKAEAAAPPDDPADAEALDKAPPEPPRKPAKLAVRPAPPKPPARPARLAMASPQALPTAIDQLAGSSDLPDYVFAKPQRKPTKYKGGTEDSRYLAIVYAMVTQNHEAIALPDGDWQVAVAFQVDGHGSLVGIGLTQSSGYPEVDAAAIDAVRRAAPFPPPPSGGLTGMIARLNAAHARAAMARGR